MIKTSLKKILAKSGKSQTAAARECGIAPSRFSDVVNGRAFLDEKEFAVLCKVFGVEPGDVYDSDILEIVYAKTERKRKDLTRSVQVRVSVPNIEWIDRLVENGTYESRCEAVNGIISAKRRQGNGWNDIDLGEIDG